MPPEASLTAPEAEREDGLASRVAPSAASGEKTYRVRALWRTLQGEGFWAGRPAVFVRLVACNMWSGYEADRARDAERNGADCPLWCDTAFTKEGSVRLTASDLADAVVATGDGVTFCVLTGGEPLLQADAALIRALHARGVTVAVETNGTLSLAGAFGDEADWPDWIVCSPKLAAARLEIETCDELKLVVPDYRPEAYRPLAQRVRERSLAGPLLWLQPEDGPRFEAAARLAVDLALADPRWRVSVQGHKALGVD
ncbi:7-carboxy-7-deazaguanine synthase QueE [Rubricoccus marinus]|uniref:7-carboxy-7-deazaguanine synthase QueE n=1 Tax=Rubricoccus marinus TaxID=716817 RepID=UPI001C533525|nr:7-carboxy-7-deazaguanine synthase QueE [Rubricoccus marinus]